MATASMVTAAGGGGEGTSWGCWKEAPGTAYGGHHQGAGSVAAGASGDWEAERPLGMRKVTISPTGSGTHVSNVDSLSLEACARDPVPGAAGREDRTHHCTGWRGSGPGRLQSPNSCSLPAGALLSSTLGPGEKGTQGRAICSGALRPSLPQPISPCKRQQGLRGWN